MNVPDRDEFHDELTDDELNDILVAVHQDLLAHAHQVADPIGTLVAIMDHDGTDAPLVELPPHPTISNLAAQRLSAVIEMRYRSAELHDELSRVIARARDVAVDLDRALHDRSELVIAFKAARTVTRYHDRQLAEFLDRARDLAVSITHDLARVRDLDRDLATERDRIVLKELAIDVNADQTFDGIRELDRALTHNRELNIDRQIAAARELSLDLDRARRISRDREQHPDLDRSRARQLAIAIDVALVQAKELANDVRSRLNTFEVDACGADLSQMHVRDPEVLIGVIWTDDTTWPPSVADRVRVLSHELSDGVYQVRGGGHRYATELIAV